MTPSTTTTSTIQELDYRHLWHPYTDINAYEQKPDYTCFERADGVYLYDTDGRAVLDGIASWWAVALGHSHPRIVEAIREQAGVLQHSILGNQAHPLAVQLAARLAALCPGDLNHCYFAADGASATEAALKIAIQYWWNRGVRGKNRFISLEEGYHGDTLGAVGVGFVPTFHAPFEDAVVKAYTVPAPHRPANPDPEADRAFAIEAFAEMERVVAEKHDELAGVILEPLCQGAAGIRIYDDEYLRRVRGLCDEYDLLLIADEIAVGFGRTGAMFACERAGVVPDILCLGKALTGGYLPMSATIATTRVYDAFRSDAEHARPGQGPGDHTFYDGHTYCGNPITSAAALAAIDIFEEDRILDRVPALSDRIATGIAEIAKHDCIDYYKTLGAIGMVHIDDAYGGGALAKRIAATALENGLFIRPLGNALYLWPPLTTAADELSEMIRGFRDAIRSGIVE